MGLPAVKRIEIDDARGREILQGLGELRQGRNLDAGAPDASRGRGHQAVEEIRERLQRVQRVGCPSHGYWYGPSTPGAVGPSKGLGPLKAAIQREAEFRIDWSAGVDDAGVVRCGKGVARQQF